MTCAAPHCTPFPGLALKKPPTLSFLLFFPQQQPHLREEGRRQEVLGLVLGEHTDTTLQPPRLP